MYQSLTLVGNLGKDPEMRYTQSGQAVTSFSVACNRQYKNAGGETVKETTWFRVSVWGKMAETVNQYLHKGSKVLVTGRLQSDPATGGPKIFTRTDGTAGSSYEVTASEVRFLSAKGEDSDGETAPADTAASEENIPF